MGNYGRRGRFRKLKTRENRIKSALSESHLPEFIRFQQWIKCSLPRGQYQDFRNHLEPALFLETGRGLKSLHHLEAGDIIISIPYHLLITTNTVFHSDLGSIIQRAGYQFTPQQLLTVFLISEQCKEGNSLWHPYTSLLPQVYSSSVYFSHDEMKLLTTRAHQLALEYRERFDRASKKIAEFIEAHVQSCKGKVTPEHIKWAWSTLDTRSVYLHTEDHPLLIIDPEESHMALAPFLDFLNHKDTAQIRAGFNPSSLSYEIITDDKYKKHEQVFISYGPHDNARLAVNYGFTLPDNIHNAYYISLEDIKACVKADADSWNKKQSIIQENGFNQSLFCSKDGLSWSLMTALKIIVIPKEFLSSWKTITGDISNYSKHNSQANKLAKKVLTQELSKAKRHLQFLVQQQRSTHFHIAESLANDDIHILETSLKLLPL